MRTKRLSLGRAVCAVTVCLLLASVAQADLLTIGTATYQGNAYSLIYEEAQGLVWLDYSSPEADWDTQLAWVAGLGPQLALNIDPSEFDVAWQEDDWRLPDVGDDPEKAYNQTSSEMGHLYYVTLGNTAGAGGFTNSGDFQNLETESHYWTNTDGAPNGTVWYFGFERGYQGSLGGFNPEYGLAVREADVTVVPEPATLGLLTLGGLAMGRRRTRRA